VQVKAVMTRGDWQVSTVKDTSFVEACLRMTLWRRDQTSRPIEPGMIHHSDAGSQAVFNRSKQHLIVEVLDAGSRSAGTGAGVSGADPVAGTTDGCLARGSGAVLGSDRGGSEDPGGWRRGGRVRASCVSMVPARWRGGSSIGPDTVWAVSVIK